MSGTSVNLETYFVKTHEFDFIGGKYTIEYFAYSSGIYYTVFKSEMANHLHDAILSLAIL